MVRNTYIYPPQPSMQIISDIFSFTSREMPKFNSISISGYHIQEAGATDDLELAYTLADGVEYLRAGIDAGLDIDRFAPRLSFFWAIGMNFFMEVAKLRAARLLWAKLVQQFEPQNPKSLSLRTHCQTSGWSLTAQDVYNNVIRTCVEAMAATQGHTQSPAHQRPRRGARAAHRLLGPHRPQHPAAAPAGVGHDAGDRPVGRQLLRREAHLRPGPPGLGAHRGGRAGGRDGAGHRRRHPEAARRGGGRPHPGPHRLRPPAGDRRQQVRRRRPTRSSTCRKVDNAGVRAEQLEKLRRLRAERDARAVDDGAGGAHRLRSGDRRGLAAHRRSRTCWPSRSHAARAKATVGEISDALEKVFGRHAGQIRIISGVYSDEAGGSPAVDRARELVDAFAEEEGRQPRILVAKMGQDGHDRGQKVIATAFADLGFDVDVGPLFQTPGEVARQAVEADVHVVGVNSLAAGHLTLVPELRDELARLDRADIMIVVGGVIPPADHPALHEAGRGRRLRAGHRHRRGGGGPAGEADRAAARELMHRG